MKKLTHTNGWYCIYDTATKRVLVSSRQMQPGVELTYDSSRVEVLTAPTEAELAAAIAAL